MVEEGERCGRFDEQCNWVGVEGEGMQKNWWYEIRGVY